MPREVLMLGRVRRCDLGGARNVRSTHWPDLLATKGSVAAANVVVAATVVVVLGFMTARITTTARTTTTPVSPMRRCLFLA